MLRVVARRRFAPASEFPAVFAGLRQQSTAAERRTAPRFGPGEFRRRVGTCPAGFRSSRLASGVLGSVADRGLPWSTCRNRSRNRTPAATAGNHSARGLSVARTRIAARMGQNRLDIPRKIEWPYREVSHRDSPRGLLVTGLNRDLRSTSPAGTNDSACIHLGNRWVTG